MPSSSTEAAETTSYDSVCTTTPFTQIHGRPTRQDYKLLKKEASSLTSEVDNITFTWSCNTAPGEECGQLAEIILDSTPIHQPQLDTRSRAPRQSQQPQWHIQGSNWRKNARKNANLGSFGKVSYVEPPWTCTTLNTTPIQVLEHLNTRWCPLDIRARELLKATFHAN